jgi:hypothetical protein
MKTAQAPHTEKSIAPETLALIGAAVALALHKPAKILSATPAAITLDTELFILNPWSMQGRFQHFRSHSTR